MRSTPLALLVAMTALNAVVWAGGIRGPCLKGVTTLDGGPVASTVKSESGIDWRCDSELTPAELEARRRAGAESEKQWAEMKAAQGRFMGHAKTAPKICADLCTAAHGDRASSSVTSKKAECTCHGAALSPSDCTTYCAEWEMAFDTVGAPTAAAASICICKR